MRLYKLNGKQLLDINNKPFKLEREIHDIVERNVDELFDLEFIKSELSIGGFRFDTLCFDNESKSFVIIEYKKGNNYSVIDQGYTYLSILLNNKADFILEYNEMKANTLRRDQIDWSQSRIIFVSPKFNTYQLSSINFKDIPFELWEIKRYSNDTIGLQQVIIRSNESINSLKTSDQGPRIQIRDQIKVYDEQYHIDRMNKIIKEVYFKLRDRLIDWDDVAMKFKRGYISFSHGKKIFLYVNVQKDNLKLHMVKNDFSLQDPNTPFKFVKLKTRTIYSFRLKDESDIDSCLMSIKEKYESVKN